MARFLQSGPGPAAALGAEKPGGHNVSPWTMTAQSCSAVRLEMVARSAADTAPSMRVPVSTIPPARPFAVWRSARRHALERFKSARVIPYRIACSVRAGKRIKKPAAPNCSSALRNSG